MVKIPKSQAITWVEVDLSAIRHNIREIKRITRGLAIMAVVKANAYGHGLVEVSRACEEVGCEYLGIVSCEEALDLRKAKIKLPILVLSYVGVFLSKDIVAKALQEDVEFALFDLETAHFLSSMAQRAKKKVKVHIKVDTGTTRVGIYPKDFFDFYDTVKKLPGLKVTGIFTHFAKAEKVDPVPTTKQSKLLLAIQKELKKRKETSLIFHAACSAALMAHPSSLFNLGRLGISLYGLWPSDEIEKQMQGKIKLKPALAWKTKVIQVKKVKKGTAIGYDGTYIAPRDIIIAVIACGYADGYDRQLSNKGYVLVGGRPAPIRGRVCMNIMMIEVTGITGVHQGSKVTLIGHDGKETISASHLARLAKTINYDIVTRINWNTPRFYKNKP